MGSQLVCAYPRVLLEAQDGFPREIDAALSQVPVIANAWPHLIFPEWKVPLPGGSRALQNDVWVLARG
jgi:hypothetical protein